MRTKRLRIFAGPNGSGKTTIINELKDKIPFGVYINADDLEKEIKINGFLNLESFKLDSLNLDSLQQFFKEKAFSPVKLNNGELWKNFSVQKNHLIVSKNLTFNSYIAADIAEFIRQTLLDSGVSFTYETVMSHKGKLAFMETAKLKGYRVYLYFIATEDPDININRVKIRVAQHGHDVNPETIRSRYFKSLENLKDAVKLSDRAYIFDNSEAIDKLLAEITAGTKVKVFDENTIPNWFAKYLVD